MRRVNWNKKKPVVNQHNIVRVQEHFANEPNTSIRIASQVLDIKRESLRTIMVKVLGMFPYKIQVHQPLNERQIEERLKFARRMAWRIDRKEIDIRKIWFTDEAHFELTGYVNKQNCCFWGTENPNICVTKPLHSKRITVWCAMSGAGIIGPYFTTETVNSDL